MDSILIQHTDRSNTMLEQDLFFPVNAKFTSIYQQRSRNRLMASRGLSTSRSLQFTNRSISERKFFNDFDGFINDCSDLQKEISQVTDTIEKRLIEKKKKFKFQEEIFTTIRDDEYFKGARLIEDRLKLKKVEEFPENLRKIKKVLSTPSMIKTGEAISIEDFTSRHAVEYLANNKRSFGKLLDQVKEIQPRQQYKRKSKDIKINPEQTIKESYLYPNPVKDAIKRHNSMLMLEQAAKGGHSASMQTIVTGSGKNKHKLPPLTLTTVNAHRAKAEANQFFTDRKVIQHRIKKKKKTTRIEPILCIFK